MTSSSSSSSSPFPHSSFGSHFSPPPPPLQPTKRAKGEGNPPPFLPAIQSELNECRPPTVLTNHTNNYRSNQSIKQLIIESRNHTTPQSSRPVIDMDTDIEYLFHRTSTSTSIPRYSLFPPSPSFSVSPFFLPRQFIALPCPFICLPLPLPLFRRSPRPPFPPPPPPPPPHLIPPVTLPGTMTLLPAPHSDSHSM